MEKTDMKSLSILGSAIWIMAVAALNTTALAEPKRVLQAQADSIGYQCRAAVRAEMKGPDCRMPIPPNATSHCNISTNSEIELMDNKINECVRRGGPGRQAKTRS
jgi:hypothetical protein